jgi:toxin-antitoxin system PIN domain toxin
MTKPFLIDSNILIYALNKSSPYHEEAKQVIDAILKDAIKGYLTPQVLFELFAVITDSKKFPAPLTPASAYPLIETNYLNDKFPLIHPKETTWRKSFDLAKQYQISSQDIFDVTLVATMVDNDIFCIVTYDRTNFQKFSFLEVIHPSKIS